MIAHNIMFQNLSRISTEVNKELFHNHYDLLYPDVLLDIVRRLPYRSKLTGFVMLKTLLRFSDIESLDLKELAKHASLKVIQQKTNKPVTVYLSIQNPALLYLLIRFKYFQETLSYPAFIRDIDTATKKNVQIRNFTFFKKSHIFRHIQASFLYQKGFPLSVIAASLGDTEETVKNHYIHSSVNEYFLS